MSKNKRLPLKEPDFSKCNHNPEVRKSTLSFLNMTSFTCPPHFYAVCTCCGEGFEFVKDDNGSFILVTNED